MASGEKEKPSLLAKNVKVSFPSGSMVAILDELEEIASRPSQTPTLPHIGSTSKRKRGPTQCLKTHGLRYDERLPVKLNVLGQPVGTYRATLSNYLGTLARNAHLAPLTFTSWKGLKEHWDDMWKTVLSKFDIEERAKKWVLGSICSSWRNHKCRLKTKYFFPNMPDDYNFKNRPPSVPLEQWKILIKFWKSDIAKVRCEKNKTSRAKFTSVHTTGTKTFAEIRYEEMMKNIDGREPSRAEMFIMTHKPKNEETKEIISKLEDAISSHSIEPEKNSTRDDVFSQVFGRDRHGYVRTYGKGVSPSDLWGSNSRVGIQKLIDEVQRNAQVEIQSMKNRMQEEMEIKLKEQVKEQVETKLKEQLEAMKVELLNNFKIAFTQIPSYAPEVMVSNLNKEEVDIEDDG
ncbi:uncharacterized protein LOC114171147 isoform X1 [Vigna unguiculata]|uniref:uncharacterized protein LOC114171147 isoform X1 n=1 Tax=Vigna unguiculata TaxID=3917 RepID=UPI001016F27E|nr:uncharacterized protein LOC114171147 isoform X1 [Vigna unguiculata]